MTVPPGVLDYFALEATDCLARVRQWATAAARDPATPPDDARRAARTLRGAAGVAREPEFAALGQALEALLGGARAGDADVAPALERALDAAEQAVHAPRPLPPEHADRLRAAAEDVAALDGAGDGGPGARAAADDANARVVPVRALAFDGDADFVLHRAESPPATADRRFRAASAPLARALRRLVGEARAAAGDGGATAAVVQTLGADLRAAVADVRELAESYDVAPASAFFGRREAGAAALDARTLAAVDAAAAGLLGEAADAGAEPVRQADAAADGPPDAAVATTVAAEAVAEPATEPPAASAPAESVAAEPVAEEPTPAEPEAIELDVVEPAAPPPPADDFRPPTGEALVALLETGISGLGALGTMGEVAIVATVDAEAAADADGVVPVESLLYRGRPALARAREVRDLLRARPGPPDPALLGELYDLLDLAAAD